MSDAKRINNIVPIVWFSWLCLSLNFYQSRYRLTGRLPGTPGWQNRSKQDEWNTGLEAVVSYLAEGVDCDNLIPSSSTACAKDYKMPSGIKVLDFSRAPSTSLIKHSETRLLLLLPPNMLRGPPLTQCMFSSGSHPTCKSLGKALVCGVLT